LSLRAGLLALALAAGCGVSGREDLVGSYEAVQGGRRERWTLGDDGRCQIVRQAGETFETTACEWEWVDRDDRTALVVTLLPGARAATARHRTRYVLRPTRLPAGAITIPLGSGADLRKVE
jgi:hypothetical protein